MSLILVVDDEPAEMHLLMRVLVQAGHKVMTVGSDDAAARFAREDRPALVLLDLPADQPARLELLRQFKRDDPHVPVIVMSARPTADAVVEAMKCDAFDYLTKPLHLAQVSALVDRALATIGTVTRRSDPPVALVELPATGLFGRSARMIEVCKTVGRAARSDVTVLIRGESGTGKELVARALHNFGARRGRPFVAVNCAAIPESLLESELFGYERGAFTGATARRQGRFELADTGTILLDEIGDMSPLTQARVLRVLQERCFERVGGTETLHVDVRVLAATNRNLEELVDRGGFREDLYYRLNVLAIQLPPLRERMEDIPELAAFFVSQQGAVHGDRLPRLAPAALQRLMAHGWPGNVRELESCIKQAAVLCGNCVIQPEHLSLQAPSDGGAPSSETRPQEPLLRTLAHMLDAFPGQAFGLFIQEAERQMIQAALRRTDGNLSQACKLLGISRPTLRSKLADHASQSAGRSAEAVASASSDR